MRYELLECGIDVDKDYIVDSLENVVQAQKAQDYILLSNILESVFLPIVKSVQEAIIISETEINDLILNNNHNQYNSKEYTVEPSSEGCATVFGYDYEGNKVYLHSNIYPTRNALSLSNNWYKSDKYNYIVFGLGLGYDILELINISPAITVQVYDISEDIVKLAGSYGVLDELTQSGQVSVIVDPDFTKISSAELNDENTEFVIHYPSLRLVKSSFMREWLENYFLYSSAVRNQELLMLRSFNNNTALNCESVDMLLDKIKGKDAYVIAAGPSLDKNINCLKGVSDKGVIISTGTVLRKLLDNGMEPDYVVIIDAKPATYMQIQGIENCGVPLIFLSTAYYRTVSSYSGKKYIACQEGYEKAELLAGKKCWNTYSTGGSVTTLCIDLVLKAHCSRLICVGLDLALTQGLDHASGTAEVKKVADDGEFYRLVEAVGGGYVNTTKGLDGFRKWIEKRIRQEISLGTDIEFIDATEGGALIKGMKLMKLSECVGKF